jgi:hypothetical protein
MMRTLVDSRRATRLRAATVPRTPPTPRFTFYHWPSSCPFACVLLVATNVPISSSAASDPPPSLSCCGGLLLLRLLSRLERRIFAANTQWIKWFEDPAFVGLIHPTMISSPPTGDAFPCSLSGE